MQFFTTVETAEKWGVSASLVLKLAKSGRIPGTVQIGARWMIPENAEKPADARTREVKAAKAQEPDTFRFPGFEYRPLSSFDPPLNEEELIIKAATEAFYACRYRESEQLLGNLADRTNDRYRRINALYTGCMIDIYLCHTARFHEHYRRLTVELDEDFPHKAEMMEYLHSIHATLGYDKYYAFEFRLLPDYEYHESFLPRLANLSAVHLSFFGGEMLTVAELHAHEVNCILLKNSAAYADLVALYLRLGIAFGLLGDLEKQISSLRDALTLAEKYEIYYPVIEHYFYAQKLFRPVISEFSEEFRNRLEKLSVSAHRQYSHFMDTLSASSIYKLLRRSDYILLIYAMQGLTNKEIADRLHTSVGAVGKRYGNIYAQLGVNSKSALAELYNRSVQAIIPDA